MSIFPFFPGFVFHVSFPGSFPRFLFSNNFYEGSFIPRFLWMNHVCKIRWINVCHKSFQILITIFQVEYKLIAKKLSFFMKEKVKKLTENTSFACPCINSSFVINLKNIRIRINLSETKNWRTLRSKFIKNLRNLYIKTRHSYICFL